MTRRDLAFWTLGLLFLLVELAVFLFIVYEGRALFYFCAHGLGLDGQELMCH